jgi:hypothetical protein
LPLTALAEQRTELLAAALLDEIERVAVRDVEDLEGRLETPIAKSNVFADSHVPDPKPGQA